MRRSRPSPMTMQADSLPNDADKPARTPHASDSQTSAGQPGGLASAEGDTQAGGNRSAHDRPVVLSPEPKPESAPGRRPPNHQEFDVAVQRVRLEEIDGVEEELQDFIREHDLLIELNLQLDRWASECLRWTVQRLNLVVWRRKGRLVHLGSGLMLTLARRIVRHEDLITATVILNKTLHTSQKLLILGEELLFQAALARTSAMPTPQAIALCEGLEKAGRQMLRRADARQFALATGTSHATVRQHWPPGKPSA